ncbi:MAG: hypothetical protein SVW77_01555, partial [Candidatus Nanohaloarchaea archaeon]|nr:hypothetical protein [Candidatus Nanohaloarchaea archaeon]
LCNPSPGSSAVTIGASAQGTPRKRVCVWSVEASPGSVDPGTYPLTVSVRYENTLRMQQQSLKFEFDPDQQAPSPAVTRSFSNGEVSMRTRHPPRLPLNPSRVAVELTGQNVGSGELGNLGSGLPAECSSSEVRCMRLRYDGSLTNAFTQDGSGRCGRVVVRPGRRSGETQCTFTGSVSGPVTHNLRISADYRYQRRRVVPVTVAETS